MSSLADPLLVVVLLLNFAILGASRLRSVINGSALQGVLLAVLSLIVHHDLGLHAAVLGASTLLLKGIGIPWLLLRAMRAASISREVEPFIGYGASSILGAMGTAASLLFARTMPLMPGHAGSLFIPTSMATVFTGFLVLTTRRKAITQVVGYLVLENGVYVTGLLFVDAMPTMIEMGVLLDLFVGIAVMGIIVHQINKAFTSMDTSRMSALRD